MTEEKWRELRGKYKHFIREDKRTVVEKWINTLSEPRQQKRFRYLVKQIHAKDVDELPRGDMDAHKARVVYQQYAQNMVHPDYRSRTLSWLFNSTAAQKDVFREVFTALDIAVKEIAPLTTMQSEYPQYAIAAITPEEHEAKARNNLTFMSQMTIVREVMRKQELEALALAEEQGKSPESKDTVTSLLRNLDNMKAVGKSGFMKQLLSAPNDAAVRNTQKHVSKADEKEREAKSKLLSEEIKGTLSKGAPRAVAMTLSQRPTTQRSSLSDVHAPQARSFAETYTAGTLPGGFATTEDGFLVTGTWDTPRSHGDNTFKSRRVQTPWNAIVGIKPPGDKQDNGYLLSRPVRRIHDVKTPWSSYINSGQVTTHSLDVHKYIPHVVSDKYNNNTDQKVHQMACNPKHTASVGNLVPGVTAVLG